MISNLSLTKRQMLMIKVCIVMNSCLQIMQGVLLAPSLRLIQNSLGISLFWIKLLMPMASLGTALFGIPFGHFVDKFGYKKILLLGLLGFNIFGPLSFYFRGVYSLFIFRFCLGISTAAYMAASTALIPIYFQKEEKHKMLGAQVAALGIWGFFSSYSSGLISTFGWVYPFLLFHFGLVPLVLNAIFIIEPKSKSKSKSKSKISPINKEDCINPIESNMHEMQPDKLETKYQNKRERIKSYWLTALAILTIVLCHFFFNFVPLNLADYMYLIFNAPASEVGLTFGLTTFLSGSFSLFYSYIIRNFSYYAVALFALLSLFATFVFFPFILHKWTLYLGLLGVSIGMGIIMPNIPSYLTTITPRKKIGIVLGLFNTAIYFGQFMTPFALNLFLNLGTTFFLKNDHHLPLSSEEMLKLGRFRFSFLLVQIIFAIFIFLFILLGLVSFIKKKSKLSIP